MAIKDVLPRLRRERWLTQEELAKRLFITRQAVGRWESGFPMSLAVRKMSVARTQSFAFHFSVRTAW